MKKTLSAAFILSLAVSPSFAMLRGSWPRAASHNNKNADFARKIWTLIHSENLKRGKVYPTPGGDFKYLGTEGRGHRFEGPNFIDGDSQETTWLILENGEFMVWYEGLGFRYVSLGRSR